MTRDELMELLWPGEDPAKLPQPALGRAERASRRCRRTDVDRRRRRRRLARSRARVDVDVERLLDRDRPGRRPSALYAGDFLEEDRYEDWAPDLREQAREAYASALRTRARETRDDDEAVRTYLRLLEHDRWDASAHRELIARLDGAGRHGEAIRRRRTYIRAMAEIGVQAAL